MSELEAQRNKLKTSLTMLQAKEAAEAKVHSDSGMMFWGRLSYCSQDTQPPPQKKNHAVR